MYGLYLAACIAFIAGLSTCTSYSDKKELTDLLIKEPNYDKDISPGSEDGPLKVQLSLTPTYFIDLDDHVMTIRGWLGMVWKDHRLGWDNEILSSVGENIEKLHIPVSKLWRPDVVLYNNVETFSGYTGGDLNAVVFSDGTVYFYNLLTIASLCRYNEDTLDQYNNTVVCTMTYGSWTYDAATLDLQPDETVAFKFDETATASLRSDWIVLDSSVERVSRTYSCCPEPYVSLEFSLTLQKLKNGDSD